MCIIPLVKKDCVAEENVQAMSIVRRLLPWREMLERSIPRHGNCTLQMMDVVLVMTAAFFNPLVRSQRLIDALSDQQWMQDQTGTQRIARSTLSDALKRFDPESLRPLIGELEAQVQSLGRHDPDLGTLLKKVLAADGTYFNLPGEVAWALHNRRGNTPKHQSRVRLNLQLDIDTFTPVDCDVSGQDDASEPQAFSRRIHPDVIYVLDRNFIHFRFLKEVLAQGSNFVLRLRKNANFDVQGAMELTDRDRESGVLRDEIGVLAGPRSSGNADCRSFTSTPPAQTLRRVTFWNEESQCEVVVLTDILDVPAYVVGALYRNRWQVELFFKWLKCFANCDHVISHNRNGITLQFYIAMIATLLLRLHTGRRVSKYALFWLGSVASGTATLEEMERGLARIEREKQLERARLERKRQAAKKQG